jgi:hypothetical protein
LLTQLTAWASVAELTADIIHLSVPNADKATIIAMTRQFAILVLTHKFGALSLIANNLVFCEN